MKHSVINFLITSHPFVDTIDRNPNPSPRVRPNCYPGVRRRSNLSSTSALPYINHNSTVQKQKQNKKCELSKRVRDSLALSSLSILLIRARYRACYRHPTVIGAPPTVMVARVYYAPRGPSVNIVASKSTPLMQVRPGNVIEKTGKFYQVIEAQHKQRGRGGAMMQMELRDVDSGNKISLRFGTEEAVESMHP
ncbi:hypothetical protein Patl1_30020 [Pistacia atlantica]|uniref:Uncharacterized protein n=1 Tax=Pistacia atlantica TaxID=434234 RepID=A0ACC1AC96_9ROSI|nr:hypothetical protein Patl1_30020 [Pistacia atlantica]